MREINFYKLTLELDKKLNKDKINLLDKLQEVVEAKSRFNQANSGRKHLVILNLTPQSANLLLRLDGISLKSVGIRTISLFISVLNSGPGFKTALSEHGKKSFRLSEVRLVEYEKSKAIVDALYSGGNEFINPSDMQKFFYGLDLIGTAEGGGHHKDLIGLSGEIPVADKITKPGRIPEAGEIPAGDKISVVGETSTPGETVLSNNVESSLVEGCAGIGTAEGGERSQSPDEHIDCNSGASQNPDEHTDCSGGIPQSPDERADCGGGASLSPDEHIDCNSGASQSPDEHTDCSDSSTSGEEFPTTSLKDALDKVSAVTGYAAFKKEIAGIVRLAEVGKKSGNTSDWHGIPYNYVFTGDAEMDHEMPARLMAEVFWHLGLIKKRRFAIIDIPEDGSEYSGINFESSIDLAETGIVFVKGIFDGEEENIDPRKVLNKLSEKMNQYKGSLLIILSYHDKKDRGICEKALLEALDSRVNYRRIMIPVYSGTEVSDLIVAAAKKRDCTISQEAVRLISVNIEKGSGIAQTVDYTVEKAYSDKAFALLESNDDLSGLSKLDTYDFGFIDKSAPDGGVKVSFHKSKEIALPLKNVNTILTHKGTEPDVSSTDPAMELDAMIGLVEVKNRVRQISNILTVRAKKKELGLEGKPVCLHMQFVGNPGTGKTTVARIMGKILGDLGLLSSGHFIELTRNDLVGEYIGQTTPKVKKAIKKAKGGIMFIDEAYSLYQGSDNDYGYEAVSELIKAMEDLKDDLVVIFAGYPKEMEKMVNMNPGLRDRIAFRIEFPDFTSEELVRIFVRMCSENRFIIAEDALEALNGLIRKNFSARIENFGNARIIRKIFERVEIIQSGRICEQGGFDRSKINVIDRTDIEKLYDDAEIRSILKGSNSKVIGFRQSV
ncbi:MAG TPA: AAA family ATPase [Clostridia bacterium]|nr:AAA family ATPase [Clostridia bacterium]